MERVIYEGPSSIIKAAALLLNNIEFTDIGNKLDITLDICTQFEAKIKIISRNRGATGEEFTKYIMDTLQDPKLEEKWKSYQK